jgi:hypothetical protein
MSDAADKPSFSIARRWGTGLNVVLLTLVVLAVVTMVNYVSRDYARRWHWSLRTKNDLSPRTQTFLKSLTNDVQVVVYFDRDDGIYSTVVGLLQEYQLANPRIKVERVDYLRDPGGAARVKNDYKLAGATDKNLVIFDCEHRVKIVPGEMLAKYTLEQLPNEKEQSFRRRATAFMGESAFTTALLNVANAKALTAYFLTGHGEHQIESGDDLTGYLKFSLILKQNHVDALPLSLLNSNPVPPPSECNLLVIARPTAPLLPTELERIEQYLNQGGRLLALFDFEAGNRETGVEKILAKWGVGIGNDFVKDPENTMNGSDVIVSGYSKHPLVAPLVESGSALYLIRPRPVGRLTVKNAPADAPRIDELAFTGPKAVLAGDPSRAPQRYPVMLAVEKGAVQGVTTERGATRMVVTGDSLFLANNQIEQLGNRDFAGLALNWLLERPELVKDLGPKPMNTYLVIMSASQQRRLELLLLGGMPGATLLLGGLVWLRRRR